jgi:FlaA1/EpsC-like NDP-sugar epimerase
MMPVFFKGKNVLVFGGTGTIGSRLVSRILAEKPNLVRVFSRDEYKQFQLRNRLGAPDNVEFMVGDVRDYPRVESALAQIDYVFHTAAMKRVETCEENPSEAVFTNIIGTLNVVRAAQAAGAKKVVFTSSDKAISPTNAYGATKLIAERIVSRSHLKNPATSIAMVRFGNVIGSRGSVIPLFLDQLGKGRRITVTHPQMTRFMMTMDQAVGLTIEALRQTRGGEIFVLKMPVVRIGNLARAVIEMVASREGFDPGSVQIDIIGLKPGEKMYEELMTEEESHTALETDDMYIVPPAGAGDRTYAGARQARPGTYGSHRVRPLGRDQIRQLLAAAGEWDDGR